MPVQTKKSSMNGKMISKDLLYALQTRSKRLIRELDGFTNNINDYSFEDGWTIVTETIELVREIPPSHAKYSATIKAVNRGWLAFCETSVLAARTLYETIVSELENTTWTRPEQAQTAYQLIYAFHDHQLRCQNVFLHRALREYSSRLLAIIETLSPHATQTLLAVPVKPHTGAGADVIEMLLEIYFYHTSGCEDGDLRADAANVVLPLVRANPGIGNGCIFSLLQYHPARAAIACDLIEFYLTADTRETMLGMFFETMSELLDNSGSSFLYEDLDEITSLLEVTSRQWTGDQLDTFTHYTFFHLSDTDEDRRLLLTKSKKAKRLAKMISDSAHSGQYVDALRAQYQSIGQRAAAPATAAPMAGAHQFKDLNFKLLVIEELMYAQNLLPRFDVREFIRQHTDREIMFEKEGYAVIPEVLAYFQELLIPAPLLAQVQELGFDGSNKIYHQIFPYWDGECVTFAVASIEDVALVPNLTRMSCMPDDFIDQHAAALRKRAIQVLSMD